MTLARADLVDLAVTRWYHCVTRCVRGAKLLADGPHERKNWVEHRLEELSGIFAVSVAAYSVLDDRVQLVLRLDPDAARRWSAEEVVRRRCRLYPPLDKSRRPVPVTDPWVAQRRRDRAAVATARDQLQNLGWFMKSLKERLSRLANRQDQTRGSFFEQRFKSVAILDEQSLVAACAYTDLSPLFAGLADPPQESPHTSIKKRVQHAKTQGRLRDLKAATKGLEAGSNAAAGLEDALWLCPIEDRRKLDSACEGMLEGISLGSYLLLLNETDRLIRHGKASTSRAPEEIFDRLGQNAQSWRELMERLSEGRLFGRFFASSRDRIRQVAAQRGVHHLANVGGMPDVKK